MKKSKIYKLTTTASMLALGIVLPMLFGQIPAIGSMLTPMHIPVFLCAYIAGYQYAMPMAFALPLLRSVMFSVPSMYPEAISIAFELATYAFVSGYIYQKSHHHCTKMVYLSMFVAMVIGKMVRCIVQASLLGLQGSTFVFSTFFVGVVVYSIPGVIVQMLLIPNILVCLNLAKKTPAFNKIETFNLKNKNVF